MKLKVANAMPPTGELSITNLLTGDSVKNKQVPNSSWYNIY
jgi:hypothetical protein